MANVTRLQSPQELLDYLNSITLPVGGFFTEGSIASTGWDVIDTGGKYTVIEDTPFKVTTVDSDADLLTFLGSLAGTLKAVIPKRAGGMFTFYSLVDEAAGAGTSTMIIAKDQAELDAAMNAAGVNTAIIEHRNYTIVIKD